MEKSFCRYHSTQPAVWQCVPCQRHFGDCCVPLNADQPEYAPQCPLCQGSLSYLGAANTAQPFWERLPAFFRYPFQSGPMLFCGLLVLASLFMPKSLLLWLALLAVAIKYLHCVIETASEGTREAPSLAEGFSLSSFWAFVQQIGVFLFAGIILWLAADFQSPALYWAVTVLLTLALPASIICLALEKTLAAAVSPGEIAAVIRAMGWRYLILWVFLFILWQSPVSVLWLLGQGLPKVVLAPVSAALFGYFAVVMCAMMGYAMFQYQGAMGLAVSGDEQVPGFPEAEWRRRKALAEAEVRIREGQADAARETLRSALRELPSDPRLNERYHQLLFSLNQREAFFEHLAHYLPLIESSHPQLAVGAWLHALQLQPGYRLDDPALNERLAALLLERHKPREALALLRNLHQRFPDYPHIPRAYLLAARGFAEGLGQVEPAAKLLAYIRQRYPASPLLDEVECLQQVLERMQVQG